MVEGIVVACVQRGIHGEVEKRHKGMQIIEVTTAGCNVKPYLPSIVELARKEKAKWVEIEPHTMCAAMKYADIVIRGGGDAKSKRIEKDLISPLRFAPKWSSREELETVTNPRVQAMLASKAFETAGLKVEIRIGEVIDLSKLNVPEKHHSELFLLVARPSTVPTTELIRRAGLEDPLTYPIRVPAFDAALADVELLAEVLEIHNVIFLVTSAKEREEVERDSELFKLNFPEIEAKIKDISS